MSSGVAAERHGRVHGDVQVGSQRNAHGHAFEILQAIPDPQPESPLRGIPGSPIGCFGGGDVYRANQYKKLFGLKRTLIESRLAPLQP